MNTQITKIGRSRVMGTAVFTAKFDGMRKEQEFIVYPMPQSAVKISCQSESRWIEIDSQTGSAEITTSQSGHHSSWMLQIQRIHGKTKKFIIAPEELSALKMQIFTTADKNAGCSVITTDNSAAIEIL